MKVVTSLEPLTLYTRPSLEEIYDRQALDAAREKSGLPRLAVDRHVAKVLPPGTRLVLEPGDGALARVLECSYRPYYRKGLWCLRELTVPAPGRPPESAPPLLPREEVQAALRSEEGTRYFFGGSAGPGSEVQARVLRERGFFSERDEEDPDLARVARSAGLDCSGLFNQASGYHFFGDSKDVYRVWRSGLVELPFEVARDPEFLAGELHPLDLILYRGHVMIVLEPGRIIQAVGDGPNAESFAAETGHAGPAMSKYDRVVIDDAVPILSALLRRQRRRFTSEWHFDDDHFMVVRIPGFAEP